MPFIEIPNFKLDILSNLDCISINVHLQEFSKYKLDKDSKRCKEYDSNEEFNNCTWRYLEDVLLQNHTCHVPGILNNFNIFYAFHRDKLDSIMKEFLESG